MSPEDQKINFAESLQEFWFNGTELGTALTLYIDEDDVVDLFGPEGLSLLIAHVRTNFTTQRGELFRSNVEIHEKWVAENFASTNPSLPLLAVCILAATRMHSDSDYRSTNYYMRLAELFCNPDGDPADKAFWRELFANSFSHLVPIWESTRNHIEYQGFISTIKERHTRVQLEHQPYIGYPLSQALIRRTDRFALTALWKAMGIQPGNPPQIEEIIRDARVWLTRSRGLNPILSRKILSGSPGPEIEVLLLELASDWDGQVLSRTGLKAQPLSITALEESSDRLGLRIFWSSDSGQVVAANSDEFLAGTTFNVDGNHYKVEPRRVVTLRYNPFEGNWTESGLVLYETIWLLYDAKIHEQIKKFAEKMFGQDTRYKAKFYDQGKLLNSVKLDPIMDKQQLELALKDLNIETDSLTIDELRSGTQSPKGFRPRLANGLKVSSSLASQVYLYGGAPDLIYPVNPENPHVEVVLDGQRETLVRDALAFPLSVFDPPLECGPHEIQVDGYSIHFSLLNSGDLPEPSTGPTLGKRVKTWENTLSQNAPISGAAIEKNSLAGEAARIVFAARGALKNYLVGPNGQCREIREPGVSLLCSKDVQSQTFCIWRESTEGWLIQIFESTNKYIQLIKVPGHVTGANFIDWNLWPLVRNLIDKDQAPDDLVELFFGANDGN